MSAPAPLIGVTMYGREDGLFSIPEEYVDSVRRAGGVPLLLPPGEPRPECWFETLDALVVSGGGDLATEYYGGKAHETFYLTDAERDATEIQLVRHLAASDLPGLCICRGMQVLNVALGGTLIEHLPDEIGESTLHRAPPREPVKHPLSIQSGSLLGSVSGTLEVEPYSWHHQAVRVLGDGLEVVARAPDGVIEAVHYGAHPWLLAVQWHPELSTAEDVTQQRLFDEMVRQAALRRERGPAGRRKQTDGGSNPCV
ncbi:MAG: putative glutamine amidotransferase [Chlamydiales bacterium]|jgi:putative glutamine amidotransferase